MTRISSTSPGEEFFQYAFLHVRADLSR